MKLSYSLIEGMYLEQGGLFKVIIVKFKIHSVLNQTKRIKKKWCGYSNKLRFLPDHLKRECDETYIN